MRLWLGPLQGFTEREFRKVYAKHFPGFDIAVSPFIPLTTGEKIKPVHLKDVLPKEDEGMHVVPQVLGNKADQFLNMAKHLQGIGYDEINWNLGCPSRVVVKHGRGSGLLKYPDRIEEVIKHFFEESDMKLSVKLRLGYQSGDEIYQVLEMLEAYPVDSVIIHPRRGIDMYDTSADTSAFKKCLDYTKHKVVYNGDIFSYSGFQKLSSAFPTIEDWMLGRGPLKNPFLPEQIKTNKPSSNEAERLKAFMDELFAIFREKKPHRWMSKVKEYFLYYAYLFENDEVVYRRITRINDEQEMDKFLQNLLSDYALINFNQGSF